MRAIPGPLITGCSRFCAVCACVGNCEASQASQLQRVEMEGQLINGCIAMLYYLPPGVQRRGHAIFQCYRTHSTTGSIGKDAHLLLLYSHHGPSIQINCCQANRYRFICMFDVTQFFSTSAYSLSARDLDSDYQARQRVRKVWGQGQLIIAQYNKTLHPMLWYRKIFLPEIGEGGILNVVKKMSLWPAKLHLSK